MFGSKRKEERPPHPAKAIEREDSVVTIGESEVSAVEEGEVVIVEEPTHKDEEKEEVMTEITIDEEPDEEIARAKKMGVLQHKHADFSHQPCHCPDALFAIAWGMCFLICCFCCYEYGWTQMSEAEYDDDDDQEKKRKAVGRLSRVLISQFCVALLVAEVCVHISLTVAKFAIHTSLVLTELALLGTAAFAALYTYSHTAVLLAVLAVCVLFFQANNLRSVYNASATLTVACKFLNDSPALLTLHFAGAFTAMLMLFVCSLSGFALYHYKAAKPNASKSGLFTAMFLLVLIFTWTARVLKYVVVTVVAGTAKWWWTNEETPTKEKPAVVAFFRTWMFFFGSICFGAIFVDVFDTAMWFLRKSRAWADRFPDGLCASCLVAWCSCVLGQCQGGCDVINSYAFIFVGVHGYSFLAAGRRVIVVFHQMGRKANETEVFTDTVFSLQAIAVGLVSAVFGLYMTVNGSPTFTSGTNKAELIVALIGFFGGMSVASIVFALVTGANKAIALQFSDTPRVLALSHPDEFATLATVWQFGPAALGGAAAHVDD